MILEWSEEYRPPVDMPEEELQSSIRDMISRRCQRLWQVQMTRSLRECPEQVFALLHVAIKHRGLGISQGPLRWGLISLTDTLCCFNLTNSPTTLHIQALHQLACDYISFAADCQEPEFMNQRIIYLIQAHCSHDQMKSFLQTLLTYKVPLSGFTLLHFMERFVQKGEVLIGFEVLRIAVSFGMDTSHQALQSCSVQLLRAVSASRIELTTPLNIREQTVELGISPNVILWTCIIQTAIEAGNHEEAWRWYDIGALEGLKPNRVTLHVLLKIAKRGPDHSALDRVIDIATEEGILPHDPDLVFDILHTVFIMDRWRYGYNRTFELLLSYYSRYCDIKPLRDLGLPVGPSVDQEYLDSSASQPSSLIIGMMLMVYVRSHANTNSILPLYQRYREYVAAKHPVIAPLANTDHVGNAFIKSFGYRRDCLQYCTLVIKDMLTSTPFGDSRAMTLKSTNQQHEGKPTVQTWNILLDSYMKRGYEGAAEKVLAMMRSRNIEPDQVTWNHLIAGYARRQKVDNVIQASRQMEFSGFEQDEYTLRALRKLGNKAAYFERMEDDSQSDEETTEGRNAMGVA